jgi:hypothetical protein
MILEEWCMKKNREAAETVLSAFFKRKKAMNILTKTLFSL